MGNDELSPQEASAINAYMQRPSLEERYDQYLENCPEPEPKSFDEWLES